MTARHLSQGCSRLLGRPVDVIYQLSCSGLKILIVHVLEWQHEMKVEGVDCYDPR